MLLLPIETEKGHYLYSGWSNCIVEVSHDLFFRYAACEWDDREKRAVIQAGLIPETPHDVVVFDPEFVASAIAGLKKNGPDMLVLSVTEACNFRCEYCYYSGAYVDSRDHSGQTMAAETALAAVEWYFGFPRKEYRIGFYGGEPLLQLSLLRTIVAHAERKRPEGSRVIFALTTNGGLLGGEECDFLAEKNFETFVSIDGPAAVHDRYRHDIHGNPTFGTVLNNLRSFRSRHPDYFDRQVNYSMTIAPPNPLAEIERFMKENPKLFGEKVPKVSVVRLRSGGDGSPLIPPDETAFDFTQVWDSFIESCLRGERPEPFARAVCEAAVNKIHHRAMTGLSRFVTTGGQCTPGKRCFIDTGGVMHMCERVNASFPIGSVATGYDDERIGNYLRRYAELLGSRCSDCWAARLCRKCIPMLAEGERMSESTLTALCERQKKDLAFKLARYCRGREQRNDCFDWIGKE
jgi:uncharacterized protein